jgi:ribosomal protein S18 acetylase RimI-like enzyme
MTLADYDAVVRLWSHTEGLSLTADDDRDGVARYLKRNRGLCFVALSGPALIGTVLCGHDGRRGILRHLAIRPEFRKQGLARRLIQMSLAALAQQGIVRCNVFVMDDNVAGLRFWEHLGFRGLPDDYRTLQSETAPP